MIKSRVRRFLNEKHNVTTAVEFVEAIYSNEGTRSVYAYEARLDKQSSDPPSKLVKISLLNNFSIDHAGIHRHRSWKVGDGKPNPFTKLEQPRSICTTTCSNTPKDKTLLFVTTQARNKQQNLPKNSLMTHAVVDKSPAARTKLLIQRSFVLKFISQVELNDS